MNHAPDATSDDSSAPHCPACARPHAVDARFCPGCGLSVPDAASTDPTPVAVAGATRACPSCAVPNPTGRMLCGVCGIDLDTGDPRLTVVPSPSAVGDWPNVPAGSDDGSSRRRWWVPVLAALLVVGGVTTTIVGLGLGPFADPEEVPEATFVAERYPGGMDPLTLTDVATVTFRAPEGGRSFTPEHLVDGDPTTSWHGDADRLPAGANETIDLFLQRPAWVGAIVVDNGDQLDPDAYAASARVQRAELVFDGEVRIPVTLLDQGGQPQIVELDEPVLTTSVRIEIREVVPGTDRTDVAMTRLELRGHPARDDDVAVAEERFAVSPAGGVIVLPEG